MKMTEIEDEEKIDKEFSDLIREKLTDKQFWEYVSSWKDSEEICEEMENWDTLLKKDAIQELKEQFMEVGK